MIIVLQIATLYTKTFNCYQKLQISLHNIDLNTSLAMLTKCIESPCFTFSAISNSLLFFAFHFFLLFLDEFGLPIRIEIIYCYLITFICDLNNHITFVSINRRNGGY